MVHLFAEAAAAAEAGRVLRCLPNLVIDDDGYVRITDFGIARVWRPENAQDTSGTPGYMAPEVMCKNNHGIAADYFAVGVIAYECMNSRRPYQGKTRREIRDAIL